MAAKKTTKQFIRDAEKVHGRRYDYCETKYKSAKEKVIILCKEHGFFEQHATSHLSGKGCPECGRVSRSEKMMLTDREVFVKLRRMYGKTYSFLDSEYLGYAQDMEVNCKHHGIFLTSFAKLMDYDTPCPGCRDDFRFDKFVQSAKFAHGNKFFYDVNDYNGYDSKMRVFCNLHGYFETDPQSHINAASGSCEGCKLDNMFLNFIESAIIVHGDRYLYDNVDYRGPKKKVLVTCRIHGDFSVKPEHHVQHSVGCRRCGGVLSKGERVIAEVLDSLDITYVLEKTFSTLRRGKYALRFDFFISEFDCVIEYHGEQHYVPVEFFGGKSALEDLQARDDMKEQWAYDNNINYLSIRYDELNQVEYIITDFLRRC